MPFQILRGDITELHVDAIVNAANSSLLGGGGVDGAIHRAAGPELREYCAGLGGCRTGEAKLSPGFRLPAKWIIHTVGPVWDGGGRDEEALLAACYRNSLALALEQDCASVAFPLISAGAYGYPKDQALAVAVREIRDFLREHEMAVTLVVFQRSDFRPPAALLAGLRSWLDRRFYEPVMAGAAMAAPAFAAAPSLPAANAAPPSFAAAKVPEPPRKQKTGLFSRPRRKKASKNETLDAEIAPEESSSEIGHRSDEGIAPYGADRPRSDEGIAPCGSGRPRSDEGITPYGARPRNEERPAPGGAVRPTELDERLRCLDESFSEMLLRKIDEKGITDAACYKRANVDRKLFSKIRSDSHYRPSKPTAIAFAVALELPLPEARELLMKAGFALSPSSKFDVIIEYFLANGRYDIFEINEALFAFDQTLLGA